MGQLGVDAYGVDPSPHAVEAAQHRELKAYQGTSQDLRSIFQQTRFGTITANHVIEHVHDPVAVIHHLGEVLAANGRIVIAVPNSRYWACRALRKAWHSTDVPRHIQQFTLKSVSIAAERAGLVVEKLWTYSLPRGVTNSCQLFLRHFAMIPYGLPALVPGFAAFTAGPVAKMLDRRRAGEAILVWLRHHQ
jgi:SAM-dependent methyltransferase